LEVTDYTSLAALIVDTSFKKGQVLFKEGTDTSAALYIVREGQVQLTSKTDTKYKNIVIKQGGLFGEEMLERDAKSGADPSSEPLFKATYTATVMEDCILGCLTLAECRMVLDTTRIGKSARSSRFPSINGDDIPMSSLTRHAILGAGTFGQVWLVSRRTSDGHRRAYALKIQSKYELVRNSQARGVVQEKNIMAQLHHPFIINLVTTYADKQRVYMLLELVQGGELYSLLHRSNSDSIPEVEAKFYAACIMEGLGYMHRRCILYRDLKPENVLIDNTGYPVIVDLGFGTLCCCASILFYSTPYRSRAYAYYVIFHSQVCQR
jgi:Protein kinase domain/Cyclic nucleotide-binding domain